MSRQTGRTAMTRGTNATMGTMLSRTLTLWNLSEGLAQDHSLKGQRHLSAPRHYVGGPCGGYVR